MNRKLIVVAFALNLICSMRSAGASGDKPAPIDIPLDQIWAYDMPGTRDVRSLEPKADPKLLAEELKGLSPDKAQRRMVDEFTRRLDHWKILKALSRRPKEVETAGPAFVVVGTGKTALANAAVVFADRLGEQQTMSPDTDLTLVFYSHSCGRYVQLHSVERWMNVITVKYQFVSHVTMEMTKHFALIPIGRLSEGTYGVNIEQLEPVDIRGQRVAQMRAPQRLVSDSFSFVVRRD